MLKVVTNSPRVVYSPEYIESKYSYQTTRVNRQDGELICTPHETLYHFRTERKVPKLGCMMVGWGGNNGSTVTASVLANQLGLSWHTKDGIKHSNYYGSIIQASTVCLGTDMNGKEEYIPLKHLMPFVDPNDIVFDGWDISSKNLADAMARAAVLDYNLQEQLIPHMHSLKPRPSIYFPDFIAANQAERADNVLSGTKWEQLERIRQDIRDFRNQHGLDKVIIMWTANTERLCDVIPGVNDTSVNLLQAIQRDEKEISPSSIFAVASILEGCCYINGSPQNTFVPGVIDLAQKERVFIGGDDFKSGQTKVKSVVVDFLVSAGIKPTSIVSYNHLGNNDGKNLSAHKQFRSKEISKSSVVDDMVESNRILYSTNEKPDHCVVIKYVPYVGDSKRAMDEYSSQIMMGGHNTMVIYNTCEDSLLASPLILDLIIMAEMCQRITFRVDDDSEYQQFNSVLSILSYMLKAPMVPEGTPVVNALFRQKSCIENIFRACIGLSPNNHMLLEHKLEHSHLRKQRKNVDIVPVGIMDDPTTKLSDSSEEEH